MKRSIKIEDEKKEMSKKKYENLPFNFYKYVHEDLLFSFEEMIEDELIRFTQPLALNDPFELLIHIDSIFNVEQSINDLDLYNKSFEENYLLNLPANYLNLLGKEFCLSMAEIFKPIVKPFLSSSLNQIHDKLLIGINKILPNSVNEALGILCLSEAVKNNALWAHYTNNHRGFQIVFDAQNDWFQRKSNPEIDIECAHKVKYSSTMPKIDCFQNFNLDIIKEICFSKSDEWSYEKEWRLIKPLKNAIKTKEPTESYPHKVYLFNIPRECICGIIFGINMNKEYKRNIMNKIENNPFYSHISAMQAKIEMYDYSIMPDIIRNEYLN